MPTANFFGKKLKQAILDKKVSEIRLNDALLRILTSMIKMGFLD